MRRYIIRRLVLAVFVVWLASFLTFSLARVVPGDVVDAMIAEQGAAYYKTAAEIRHGLGLDRSFLAQYVSWMNGIFHGDLGMSLWQGGSVASNLRSALVVSIELGAFAVLIAWFVGITIGVISAIRQDTPVDYIGRVGAILGLSLPDFWVATIFILYMSLWFHYSTPLPLARLWDEPLTNLQQVALPVLILGVRLSSTTMRMMRSTMLEVLRADYVRTAWAKGMRERTVIFRHALKNAMIPVITIVGGQVPLIFGGTVILETIFSLPGVGRLTFTAVQQRDYPQVQGNVLFMSSVIVLMNLIVDISYAWFDPRIRYR